MRASPAGLPPDFDPHWYLSTYDDVRDADIDPGQHYLQYGWSEGRLPTRIEALELDHVLWRGREDMALRRLEGLFAGPNRREAAVAGWVLARWWASLGAWQKAYRHIAHFLREAEGPESIPHAGPFLLGIQASLKCDDATGAQAIFTRLRLMVGSRGQGGQVVPADLDLAEILLARAALQEGEATRFDAALARLHSAEGLAPVSVAAGEGVPFDRLVTTAADSPDHAQDGQPLVSVIVPVFNAARTLPTALRSLLAQDWSALEILVVDDGSSDDSLAVARDWAARDTRISVLAQGENQGAYPARNAGLAAARGAFVTVHDSDDWSHPAKIRLQAEALMANDEIKASVSHWVRCSDTFDMTLWRMETGWVYRNVSSLMIRAELRESLGYWDRVRVNADTEYYHRIQACFGSGAIQEVRAGVPLAFGRTEQQSLTMQSATHLRTQFKGVRRDYLDAALYWHKTILAAGEKLYLAQFPQTRPFAVPSQIGPADPPGPRTPVERIAASSRFDAAWYLTAYPDVMAADVPAAQHYLEYGASEDRDPGPLFSSSAYRLVHGLGPADVPLLHWEDTGRAAGLAPLPSFPGRMGREELPKVLVFAHMAHQNLSGAERSFLDVLSRLNDLDVVPIAIVPAAHNPEYIQALSSLCGEVEVLPQLWRHGDRAVSNSTVEAVRDMIRRHRAQTVYVNTLTLDAPLVAARAEGCASVVLVRELPAEDTALCDALGFGAAELRARLLEEADRFIVNSDAVAKWLAEPARTEIWPNIVSEDLFSLPFEPADVLRVGMVSSNIAKKGLADFMEVARRVAEAGDTSRFLLIGPSTPDLLALRPWPPNVEHAGYAHDAVAAMKQVDLVMSLSHFAESFGRTVLEAMCAGRPVICYGRGTPPVLVEGQPERFGSPGGIVVPADNPGTAARAVLALSAARTGLMSLGKDARKRAAKIQENARTAHV